jgi:hypothetical protein
MIYSPASCRRANQIEAGRQAHDAKFRHKEGKDGNGESKYCAHYNTSVFAGSSNVSRHSPMARA